MLFPYLQSTNSAIWTRGSDQVKAHKYTRKFESTLENVIG